MTRFWLCLSAAIAPALLLPACNSGSALRTSADADVEVGARDMRVAGAGDTPIVADAGDTALVADAVPEAATSVDALFLEGAVCPAGVAVLDICGCGCCGGQPGAISCYYPALGQTRDAIPNPVPPSCAAAGCAFGGRHLCCADPGQTASTAVYCAKDSTSEDYPSFTVSKRDGAVCTDVVFSLESTVSQALFPISSSWGRIESTSSGPCDGSGSSSAAIGGLGTIIRDDTGADGLTHLSMHLALFFDSGAGAAGSVRFDVADVVLGNCSPSDGGP